MVFFMVVGIICALLGFVVTLSMLGVWVEDKLLQKRIRDNARTFYKGSYLSRRERGLVVEGFGRTALFYGSSPAIRWERRLGNCPDCNAIMLPIDDRTTVVVCCNKKCGSAISIESDMSMVRVSDAQPNRDKFIESHHQEGPYR